MSPPTVSAEALRGWRAAAAMHHQFLTGLLLYLLQKRGPEAGTEFLFRTFRAQHEEKFLAGLKTLGLDGLPDAIACARFIYLANLVGGVKVEYTHESDRKAWVRYPPPRWAYEGAAICAVPTETSIAFMRAFHAQCGVTLGNPRLGFVCTKITTEGHPGLEGYFIEEDRDLGAGERLRFAFDESGPPFDSTAAPRLDWPEERLLKAQRNYALQYIRIALPQARALLGDQDGATLARAAARLIGMQLFDQTCTHLGIAEPGIAGFAEYLAGMCRGGGDAADWSGDGEEAVVRMVGWRLMAGSAQCRPEDFDAWNGLWEGALAAHDHRLSLSVEARMDVGDDEWRWRISRR